MLPHAPRLVLALTEGADRPLVPGSRWSDTEIDLPDALRGQGMRDVVTGLVHETAAALPLAEVTARFPVALLTNAGA